jgi:hypothetical protein
MSGKPAWLWSLADMINFYLDRFVHHWRDLVRALREAEAAVKIDRNAEVPASSIDQIDEWIKGGIRYCVNAIGIREAELTKVDLEIQLGNRHFQPIIWGELFENLKRLCDQIIVGISRECFFHYARENGILIFRAEQNWSVVVGRFPSAKQEILPGIDCYALGHNTAAVFHMMRVAEIGLRALARERQVTFPKTPLEWAEWNNLIDEIEKQARAAISGMSRGPALTQPERSILRLQPSYVLSKRRATRFRICGAILTT